MSNLLLEVDEAMRWERIEKLWKNYGHYLLALVIFIILATAAGSGWNAWNEHVRTKDTEHLMALLSDEHFPDNIKPEALHMRAPLRGMALINGAGAYLQADKKPEAEKLYAQAAADKSIPPEIRQLAMLMQARLATENPETILAPILNDKKSPWQDFALLDAASYAASKNDFVRARGYLKQILDKEDTGQSLRPKAKALDRIFAAKEKGL